MLYFDHDTSAGADDKIVALRLECGGAAVDAYWALIEQIYRDETDLDIFGNQHVTKSVSHRLCTDENTLLAYISAMLDIGLLDKDDESGKIYSQRARDNIEKYRAKKETARQNGAKGGRKPNVTKSVSKKNQVGSSSETKALANKRKEKKSNGVCINTHTITPEEEKEEESGACERPSEGSFTRRICEACSKPFLSDGNSALCPQCYAEQEAWSRELIDALRTRAEFER